MDPQLTKTNHWCNKVQLHDRNTDGVGYFFRDWRLWDWRTNSIRIQKQNTVLPPLFLTELGLLVSFLFTLDVNKIQIYEIIVDGDLLVYIKHQTHLTILGFVLDKKSREMHQNLSCFKTGFLFSVFMTIFNT